MPTDPRVKGSRGEGLRGSRVKGEGSRVLERASSDASILQTFSILLPVVGCGRAGLHMHLIY